MKSLAFAVLSAVLVGAVRAELPQPDVKGAEKPFVVSQWQGRKVAFLGDSITDKIHVGCKANYWNYLPSMLGLDAYVYGKNGWTMAGMLKQAQDLKATLGGEVDAILVFAGTNDFNGGLPLGVWYDEETVEVRKNDKTVPLKHRKLSFGNSFRGSINRVLAYLKHEFPDQQIVLLTPIHRAYAKFDERNVQPDESYANTAGLYLDAYVAAIKEAGTVWSVPVIDLHGESGLYPSDAAYAKFFHNAQTDMLHPNDAGHQRIAAHLAAKLVTLPASFK